jgi:hypothetical protein
MDAILGDYAAGGLSAAVSLTLYPDSFPVRWSQASATADFVAGYLGAAPACRGREGLRGSLGYVLNELVENAVKFSAPGPISVAAGVTGGEVVLLVQNPLSAARAAELRPRLEELCQGDPAELLVARVEANAEDPTAPVSGLGFLTMMTDYGARLGWRFEPDGDGVRLSTMARLPIDGG